MRIIDITPLQCLIRLVSALVVIKPKLPLNLVVDVRVHRGTNLGVFVCVALLSPKQIHALTLHMVAQFICFRTIERNVILKMLYFLLYLSNALVNYDNCPKFRGKVCQWIRNLFFHIMKSINITCRKLCSFNSRQLMSDELTTFLGDIITR